jgi:hypothetical protein
MADEIIEESGVKTRALPPSSGSYNVQIYSNDGYNLLYSVTTT